MKTDAAANWNRKRLALIFILVAVTLGAGTCAKKRRPAVSAPSRSFSQVGVASWYGREFQGRKTASGERFNMYDLTAAHPSLPFGSRVKVTNLENGKSVIVRINDRGPHVKGRIIDLSYAAAKKIGMVQSGTARVKVELIK
jgi:rare lipoprotein A